MKTYSNAVFCKSVKKLIKEFATTQREIAEKIGMPASSFCNKINGCGGKFTLIEALRIADELGENVEDMATGNL